MLYQTLLTLFPLFVSVCLSFVGSSAVVFSCHHHGPQGEDPYPAEGQPGCPKQTSPKHVTSCDSTAQAPHNDFKNDKYTFSGSTQAASGVEKVQEMIMSGGPVETAFTVYTDFQDYAGGIYQHTTGSAAGGHAVSSELGWMLV